MIDRIRIATHRALARLVMGAAAPCCPYCGSPALAIETDMIDGEGGTESILTSERCQTCGEGWAEGSDAWNDAHPPQDWRLNADGTDFLVPDESER